MSEFGFDVLFFFFKQKTAYEMRISDWSSDVCSSDLVAEAAARAGLHGKGIVAGHGCGIERNVAIAKFDERIALLGKDEADVRLGGEHTLGEDREIGRASCRERECQYV